MPRWRERVGVFGWWARGAADLLMLNVSLLLVLSLKHGVDHRRGRDVPVVSRCEGKVLLRGTYAHAGHRRSEYGTPAVLIQRRVFSVNTRKKTPSA